jgi:hypothetical protein
MRANCRAKLDETTFDTEIFAADYEVRHPA